MKTVAQLVSEMSQDKIRILEANGEIELFLDNESYNIGLDEVEIISENVPGYSIATDGSLTVALDIIITPELWQEGMARDFINRIQNIRKESDFDVTDKIKITAETDHEIEIALANNLDYICTEVLADELNFRSVENFEKTEIVELQDNKIVKVYVSNK
jgi:isoleucyl-tRNA synthetase